MAPEAAREIQRAAESGELYCSPVSAWEVGVLASRGRLKLGLPAEAWVERAFTRPEVRIAPLSHDLAVRASYLPGTLHPDPADRLLVATALGMGLRLVTRDARLIAYGGQGYLPVLAC